MKKPKPATKKKPKIENKPKSENVRNTEKPGLEREAALAKWWRNKSGLPYSDFDAICGQSPPPGYKTNLREPAYDVLQPNVYRRSNAEEHSIKDLRTALAHIIVAGYPLSFGEYHLAIAFGFLIADGVSYEEFFKERWHETRDHRGYCPLKTCGPCHREREAKKE
jgi:hypothetical protein